jgi:hypothetical protein
LRSSGISRIQVRRVGFYSSHYCAKLEYIYEFVKGTKNGFKTAMLCPEATLTITAHPFTTMTFKLRSAIEILIKLYMKGIPL